MQIQHITSILFDVKVIFCFVLIILTSAVVIIISATLIYMAFIFCLYKSLKDKDMYFILKYMCKF